MIVVEANTRVQETVSDRARILVRPRGGQTLPCRLAAPWAARGMHGMLRECAEAPLLRRGPPRWENIAVGHIGGLQNVVNLDRALFFVGAHE